MQETQIWFLGWEDLLEKEEVTHSSILGLPWWLSCQRIHLQCGRPGFNPWVGTIPWRRERLPTPVFWPGEFGSCTVHGITKSRTQLSIFLKKKQQCRRKSVSSPHSQGYVFILSGLKSPKEKYWNSAKRGYQLNVPPGLLSLYTHFLKSGWLTWWL